MGDDVNCVFLREWLTRLERGDLTTAEVRRMTEFVMRERFLLHLRENMENVPEDNEKWLKYLTLGWFVYEQLGVEGR